MWRNKSQSKKASNPSSSLSLNYGSESIIRIRLPWSFRFEIFQNLPSKQPRKQLSFLMVSNRSKQVDLHEFNLVCYR